MALLSISSSPIFLARPHNQNHNNNKTQDFLSSSTVPQLLSFSRNPPRPIPLFRTATTNRRPASSFAASSDSTPEPDPDPDPDPDPNLTPSTVGKPGPGSITDEWGERAEPEPEYPRVSDSDPPQDEDEWEEGYAASENGSAASQGAGLVVVKDARVEDLKRSLVDTVYGTGSGFRASPEVRAEVSELVNQLEYTSFSELLPLLAVGTLPLWEVKTITQAIDISNASIANSITLSSPFATLSFSASATFEVRSPSRIQVEFKEGTLQPPEIKSSIELPENASLFGQNFNLSPVQQALNPLQEAVANISRTISGQSPIKVPIPRNPSRSWLLITYLDEDLRISRGDRGLFVLAREGSPLLDQ